MTKPLSLRDKKRQRTYMEIGRAALHLFQTNGYQQTTVEQIAAKAEYSMSTFFRYFASKEDVAFFGVSDLFLDFEDDINNLPEGVSPWNHVTRCLVDACKGLSELEPEIGVDPIVLWISEPTLERRFLWLSTEWEKQIADAYAQLHKLDSDESLKARLVGKMLIAAAHAAFQAHVKTGAPIDALINESIDLIGKGLAD